MTELCIFLVLLILVGTGLCWLAFSYGYNKGNLDGYKEGMEDAYSTASNFLREEMEIYEDEIAKETQKKSKEEPENSQMENLL